VLLPDYWYKELTVTRVVGLQLLLSILLSRNALGIRCIPWLIRHTTIFTPTRTLDRRHCSLVRNQTVSLDRHVHVKRVSAKVMTFRRATQELIRDKAFVPTRFSSTSTSTR
jgi:hypothetical protein